MINNMTPREELIFRLEQAYRLGRGVRLTNEELGLLHAKEVEQVEPVKAPVDRIDVDIRWLIRRDLPEVLSIEHGSFEFPWVEEDFLEQLRKRNVIGMIAEHDHKVVGFMIYGLEKDFIDMMNLAVHPDMRGRTVGRQMIYRLIDELSQQRRERIKFVVRETNVSAQKFLSACGFKVIDIEREAFEETDEDAYRMEYQLREGAKK